MWFDTRLDMANRSYDKGRKFEYKVRDFFREKGWFCIRQAKSSFPDLFVSKESDLFAIECKVNKYLSKEETRKMVELEEVYKIPALRAWPKKIKGRTVEIVLERYQENKWKVVKL